jgi:hypothetical protein
MTFLNTCILLSLEMLDIDKTSSNYQWVIIVFLKLPNRTWSFIKCQKILIHKKLKNDCSDKETLCREVSHVPRATSDGDFRSFPCFWESPPSIWFKGTRKPRCTGPYQTFTGKGHVVARKNISTPSAPYLR